MKFYQNLYNGSPVVFLQLKRRTEDMTKLIIAFRNFENAPKMQNTCELNCNIKFYKKRKLYLICTSRIHEFVQFLHVNISAPQKACKLTLC